MPHLDDSLNPPGPLRAPEGAHPVAELPPVVATDPVARRLGAAVAVEAGGRVRQGEGHHGDLAVSEAHRGRPGAGQVEGDRHALDPTARAVHEQVRRRRRTPSRSVHGDPQAPVVALQAGARAERDVLCGQVVEGERVAGRGVVRGQGVPGPQGRRGPRVALRVGRGRDGVRGGVGAEHRDPAPAPGQGAQHRLRGVELGRPLVVGGPAPGGADDAVAEPLGEVLEERPVAVLGGPTADVPVEAPGRGCRAGRWGGTGGCR